MQLVEAAPIPTPADAERLVADLWQMSYGRPFGLFIIGFRGERVLLGVHSTNAMMEDAATATIADQCGGTVEPGWTIPHLVDVSDDMSVINMVPTDRHLALDSSTFGWQRTDPLRGAYTILANLPESTVAGVGMTLRALPGLQCVVSLAAFALGPGADMVAMRLASSYGGVGVFLRRPFSKKRTIRRMFNAALRRPTSVKRVEVVSLFWHPPYNQDAEQVMGRVHAPGTTALTVPASFH